MLSNTRCESLRPGPPRSPTIVALLANTPQRNIPIRGLKPIWYMVGVLAIMGYGWRKVFVGGREKNELAREKMWSRIYLTPLLQAEEDRDQVRRYYADQAREKELLGTTSSAYNSDRYVMFNVGFKRQCELMSTQIREADLRLHAWLYHQIVNENEEYHIVNLTAL
jgi:NADH dehydrogenase (ubiquinone) 1 alpha subcomplex subunit 13